MDMIDSKTEIQRKMASNQISGKTSSLINELRNDMVQIISNINVNIDYPEYDDVDIITNDVLLPKITKLKEKITKILEESKNGKLIKEGIKTSIIGRPNVGKSSLLNALLEEDKAIVTDIAGTTRDIVEGQISINGILLNIIDTAGIRNTEDMIEAIGVEKSLKTMEESDLVLFMLNNNEEITDDIKELISKIKDKEYLVLINKTDLESKLDLNSINIDKNRVVHLSIINNEGIEDKVGEVEEAVKNNMPIDMIELDIKSIWEELGTINGSTYEEELLDEMFKRFCLGK